VSKKIRLLVVTATELNFWAVKLKPTVGGIASSEPWQKNSMKLADLFYTIFCYQF